MRIPLIAAAMFLSVASAKASDFQPVQFGPWQVFEQIGTNGCAAVINFNTRGEIEVPGQTVGMSVTIEGVIHPDDEDSYIVSFTGNTLPERIADLQDGQRIDIGKFGLTRRHITDDGDYHGFPMSQEQTEETLDSGSAVLVDYTRVLEYPAPGQAAKAAFFQCMQQVKSH